LAISLTISDAQFATIATSVFMVLSEWKVLLLGFWLVFLLLSYEGLKADAVFLADQSIIEAERSVLLILGD